MSKVFESSLKVKFRECDPAQIMFFGNIFAWSHDAFEEFIQAAGFQWSEWFKTKEYMIPIRATQASFETPFFPGEQYSVQAQVKALGTTSFTMKYRFLKPAGPVHAVVEMTHVVLDQKTKKPISLPSLIRERLEPFLEA